MFTNTTLDYRVIPDYCYGIIFDSISFVPVGTVLPVNALYLIVNVHYLIVNVHYLIVNVYYFTQ